MAKKKTEDKNRERYLKGKSLREALSELPERKKIWLGISTAIGVTALIFFLALTFLSAVTPEEITKEEFDELISVLDGRKWTTAKGDGTKLSSLMYGFKVEKITTQRSGEALVINITAKNGVIPVRFSYVEGRVRGFVSSTLFYLYHSSSKGNTSRALTLINEEMKIVLYEEV